MIGLWVARFADEGDGGRRTKWHLVESEIEDRKVTKCGRQLGQRDGTVIAPLVAPPTAADACQRCRTVQA